MFSVTDFDPSHSLCDDCLYTSLLNIGAGILATGLIYLDLSSWTLRGLGTHKITVIIERI